MTNGTGEDNLQLIDFSEEDDFLIAFPFRDSLEDLRLSVSFDNVNGFDPVQSESMEPRRPSFLRKSLAWDTAFFTSAGVLNPEELFMINKGLKRAESNKPLDGDVFHLETLEGDLFKDVNPNNIHNLSKISKFATNIGRSTFGQPNALSYNKTNIRSQNKVKSLRAPKIQSLNPQGSKYVTKTGIIDPQIIQDKVSSQPKLVSSKAAVEGSDDMKIENKTRKAGLGPELTGSKRSRWGDLSGLPKSTSFTSPTTEKNSKLHRSYDSSSSASSTRKTKTNPRNTKIPAASPSSARFSLTSICSPASPIDGCLSSTPTASNAMSASDFQKSEITTTSSSNGGPKRKIKSSSGLRMPSPKIGFFDEEQPSFRRTMQVEFNENKLNKVRSSTLSPCVSSTKVRKSLNDGRKVGASCSKIVNGEGQIGKKKLKIKDEGVMKKKEAEESQKENVYSVEDEVSGLSRELEVINLHMDEVNPHPDHCSRAPLIEKTLGNR